MRRGREEELAQLRPRGEERVALCNGTPGLTSIELVG
jgi:hypothetical protein